VKLSATISFQYPFVSNLAPFQSGTVTSKQWFAMISHPDVSSQSSGLQNRAIQKPQRQPAAQNRNTN
jgi:hypothetical protein